MPKDATKNVDRYKIKGGQLNEFDFHQNQEEFAAQQQPRATNLIPGTPPEDKKAAKKSATKATKTTKAAKATKSTKTTKSKKAAKSTKATKTAKATTKKAAKTKNTAPTRGASPKKLAARKAAKK